MCLYTYRFFNMRYIGRDKFDRNEFFKNVSETLKLPDKSDGNVENLLCEHFTETRTLSEQLKIA